MADPPIAPDLQPLSSLVPERWPDLSVRLLSETGSTNDDAKAAAGLGHTNLLIVADSQRSGRGRSGHAWHSPPGAGVYMSLLFDAPPSARVAQLPLICALALHDALRGFAPGICIKWPNDILAPDGRKVAGLLCESSARKVIVGAGINLARAERPPELALIATSLDELCGSRPPRFEIVTALLEALDKWLKAHEVLGFEKIRSTYETRCGTIGRRVSREGVSGTAVGVHEDGALQVRVASGQVVLVRSGAIDIEH